MCVSYIWRIVGWGATYLQAVLDIYVAASTFQCLDGGLPKAQAAAVVYSVELVALVLRAAIVAHFAAEITVNRCRQNAYARIISDLQETAT